MLVKRFSWVIVTRAERPALGGPFAAAASFRTEVPDPVLDLALAPAARAYAWVAFRARLLYLRRMQFQMLLILATLVAFIVWGFVW
jgi:hypothetical protein